MLALLVCNYPAGRVSDRCYKLLSAGSPIDSPVRRRSLSPRSRSRTPPRGGSAQQMHWKKKLDALFDRGVVRSSELDDRTLDALDGAHSV